MLFFELRKLLTVCSSACRFHSMVIQNLVFAISEKNRALVQKLHHISQRTTREKLISYLSEEAKRQNSGEFTIPFNRPAAGGLSVGGPQRHVQRVGQDARRGPASLRKKPVYPAVSPGAWVLWVQWFLPHNYGTKKCVLYRKKRRPYNDLRRQEAAAYAG